MSKLGNESAYPVVDLAGDPWCRGLTKRELFAAMAMQGFVSNSGLTIQRGDTEIYPTIAHDSVQLADDLLAELAKEAVQ